MTTAILLDENTKSDIDILVESAFYFVCFANLKCFQKLKKAEKFSELTIFSINHLQRSKSGVQFLLGEKAPILELGTRLQTITSYSRLKSYPRKN